MAKTLIAKWGNSLAVRIPHVLADQLGLKENTPVCVNVENDRIEISRSTTLEEMLSSLTDEDRCALVDWGSSVGRENWI